MDGRAGGDADRDGGSAAQASARQQTAQFGEDRQHPVRPEIPGVAGRPDQLSKGRSTVDHAPGHFPPRLYTCIEVDL
jgi:hypothetical protein